MRRKNCSCVCLVNKASFTDGFALRTSAQRMKPHSLRSNAEGMKPHLLQEPEAAAIHGGRESGRLCGENYYFEIP